MPEFRIFTESKADVKFISDYISENFDVKLTVNDFDTLDSWSGYKAGGKIEDSIQQNHDNGKQTILILDADNDFARRQAEIIRDFQRYNIPVHLFLFPNNSSNGNLENLLTEIATDRKLIECFEGYETCIEGYQLPISKSKIYAYLDALLPAKNKKNNRKDLIEPENRNYRNLAHWNLHHEHLQPLHNFLLPFFIETK